MRSTTAVLTAAALASAAVAQPHNHHQHARFHDAHLARNVHEHDKRALKTEWVTEWVTETVTEFIDVTATSWLTTGDAAATPTPATTTLAGQFFEGASSSHSSAAPPSKAPVVPVPAPAPSPESKSPAPAPAPAPTSKAPAPPPAAPSSSSPPPAAPAPSSTPPSNGGGGGGGGSGTAFLGEVTHYTVGLGACGEEDTGKDRTDYIVALSKDLMTSSSWPDSQCGKTVTFSYGGKTITAPVRDKCPGCTANQIDVSEKLFLELFGDLGIGRAKSVSWTLSN